MSKKILYLAPVIPTLSTTFVYDEFLAIKSVSSAKKPAEVKTIAELFHTIRVIMALPENRIR